MDVAPLASMAAFVMASALMKLDLHCGRLSQGRDGPPRRRNVGPSWGQAETWRQGPDGPIDRARLGRTAPLAARSGSRRAGGRSGDGGRDPGIGPGRPRGQGDGVGLAERAKRCDSLLPWRDAASAVKR